MSREEAIEVLKTTLPYESNFAEARIIAIKSLEAWDEVIKFISGRINYWDAPCSGDEVVRNELASVMWEIARKMKEVEE